MKLDVVERLVVILGLGGGPCQEWRSPEWGSYSVGWAWWNLCSSRGVWERAFSSGSFGCYSPLVCHNGTKGMAIMASQWRRIHSAWVFGGLVPLSFPLFSTEIFTAVVHWFVYHAEDWHHGGWESLLTFLAGMWPKSGEVEDFGVGERGRTVWRWFHGHVKSKRRRRSGVGWRRRPEAGDDAL